MRYFSIFILFFCLAQCFSQIDLGHTAGSSGNNLNHPAEQSNPEIDRIISIVNAVESKNNFIDQLHADSSVSLPFGIIKQIGSTRYVIAIDSAKFEPHGAYFSAYAAIDFPGTTKKMAFRGSHIKFNPMGAISGDQSRLYLASDHLIKINSTVSLKLSGSNRQNWIEWDCKGFKAINLSGSFVFQKGKLIPDAALTTDTMVNATFQIHADDIHDFITTISITPFKISGLNDWSFKVTDAIVDMSELSNAPGMIFPAGYSNPNITSPGSWTGFALKSLTVKIPQELSPTGKPSQLSVNNLLLDHMGLTGSFQVNNVLNFGEGNVDGWDFSIDELGVGFICNQLSSGHLKGTIGVPVMDSSQSLQYSADINYNPDTRDVNYNFNIRPESNLRFKVFSATVNLNKNSIISVIRMNGNLKPMARLSGSISFDDMKVNTNGNEMTFENLTIISDAPYITEGVFSLGTVNGGKITTNSFPIHLERITFGIDQGNPVLGFDVKLNFSELINNCMTVGTSILLKGKIERFDKYYHNNNAGKSFMVKRIKLSLDKVVINGINVDVETGPFTLVGKVTYREKDPTYGTGFFGMMDLSIKKVLDDPIGINAGFGSKDNYRYFFLDVMVPAEMILGASTPAGLSKLIGGIYYHMKPNKITEAELISLNQNFGRMSGYALSYTPTSSVSLGLKVGASGDFKISETVCNGDLFLDVHFTNSGGLGEVTLSGNIYTMIKIDDGINAPVKGRIEIAFDPQNKILDATAQVSMTFHQIVNGNGYLKLHFDPQSWYLCVGRPSAPNMVKFLNRLDASFYFMTGSSIEAPQGLPAWVPNERKQSDLQSGRGFCAGARIHSGINDGFPLGVFSIGYNYNFDLGSDVMFVNYGDKATCAGSNDKIGLNGRLAQGNVYLDMKGEVRVKGRFRFPPGCPTTYEVCLFGGCWDATLDCIWDQDFDEPIFSAEVAAVVKAKFPKPLYFDGTLHCTYDILHLGKLTGGFDFKYKYGDDCNPVSN